MTGPHGAAMAGWLALHGLDAAACRAVLVGAGTAPRPSRRLPDPMLDDPAPWSGVIAALGKALPAAAGVLARIAADVRIDLAPDPRRFPRAFTLHDDGRGLPFISCPVKGRASDLLILAHELGHACQIVASGGSDLPPVLRETAAYLAEDLVLRTSGRAAVLTPIQLARTERILARDGTVLLRALEDPGASYSYGWNYPIARLLAARAARHLSADAQWRVYTGAASLPELIGLPPE